MQDCITQKQIIVSLKTWRPLHSILFSALIEYSSAIYSAKFDDLINLGLISPDEASNILLISQVTREWLN